jgi:hypothetical protein
MHTSQILVPSVISLRRIACLQAGGQRTELTARWSDAKTRRCRGYDLEGLPTDVLTDWVRGT